MKRLLLAIAIVILFTGCYSPTYVTPAPVPPPAQYVTPIPKIPTVSTYTPPDYAYSFKYPGDWGDITIQLSHFLKGNVGSPDLVPDIILGLYPDEYHGIYIACCRVPAFNHSLTLKENLNTQGLENMKGQGISFGNTEYINSKEALIGSYDYPKTYSKIKYIYLLTSNEVLMFVVEAEGENYYNIFDNTYSAFVNSLQVR
jgi:hypothetical protein